MANKNFCDTQQTFIGIVVINFKSFSNQGKLFEREIAVCLIVFLFHALRECQANREENRGGCASAPTCSFDFFWKIY
jgi:hypothetical protein